MIPLKKHALKSAMFMEYILLLEDNLFFEFKFPNKCIFKTIWITFINDSENNVIGKYYTHRIFPKSP